MAKVIIGVDPHKLSATIEVVDDHEKLLGSGRFSTDQAGYAAMRTLCEDLAGSGLGRRGQQRRRPSAGPAAAGGRRARGRRAGQARRPGSGCSTPATTARPTPWMRTRSRSSRSAPRPCGCCAVDGELEALRMLTDRREELTRHRVQTVNRLQRLLAELLPGQAQEGPHRPAGQGDAGHRPSSRHRRQDPPPDRRRGARRPGRGRGEDQEARPPSSRPWSWPAARRLMDLHGVGPVVAARILADVGDVARFADRNRFASWTGTAPLDASSGEQNRHRLSRAGNRRMNHMIHIAAITQIRLDTDGRAYYRRKRADGKTPMEALRCLKRRISDAIYRQLVADAQQPAHRPERCGPGRALRGDSKIQRGRPAPAHRHFGSATSRTRDHRRYARPAHPEDHRRTLSATG